MPQGMGTYGSKKGRPPGKKKKVAVVKKKVAVVKKKRLTAKEKAERINSNYEKATNSRLTRSGKTKLNAKGKAAKRKASKMMDAMAKAKEQKKKKKVAPTGNQGRKRVVKKKPVNTPSAPAGYSRRTRMDMAAKEALSGGVAKKTKRKSKVIGAGMNPFPKKKKIVKVGGPKKMNPMKRKKKSK